MSRPERPARSFGSDNFAGVQPEVLAALARVNEGHVPAYGNDPVTARAVAVLRRHLGENARVFFVFNGTAANVLGLQALTKPHHAILCAAGAHIDADECGAPERFTGCKLIPIATFDGKLTPELVAPHIHGVGVPHHVQPKVISITQATELGTVYTAAEIRRLADFAHSRGMYLHMDGARLSNAAAALDVGLAALTREAGVDALSLGGTKNGLLFGEAVVFFDERLAADFEFIRKQGMQLCSKMRFVAAQFEALYGGELWLEGARHANSMARKLEARLSRVAGVRVVQPVQASGVFAHVPRDRIARAQASCFFHVWNEERSEVRLMCAFDTTDDDIERLARALEPL